MDMGSPITSVNRAYMAQPKIMQLAGVEPASATVFYQTSNMLMGWPFTVGQSEGRLALWCSSFHPPPLSLYAAELRLVARFVVGAERALHQPFCGLGREFQFASWSVIDLLKGPVDQPLHAI